MTTVHRIGIAGVTYSITELVRAELGLPALGPSHPGQALPLTAFRRWWLHHTVYVMPDYDRDGFINGDLDDVARYARTIETVRPDLGGIWPYSWGIYAGANEREAIITEGRGRGRSGAHTAGQNHTSYAAAIAGDTRTMRVTSGMVAAIRFLIARETPWCVEDVRGHQHAPPYFHNGVNLNATACPGPGGLDVLPALRAPFVIQPPPRPIPPPPSAAIHAAAYSGAHRMFIAQHPRSGTAFLVHDSGLMLECHNDIDELAKAGIKNAGKVSVAFWNRLCVADDTYRAAVKFPGAGGPDKA